MTGEIKTGNEVVKFAPEAVIDELDSIDLKLVTLNEVLYDIENNPHGFEYLKNTEKWFWGLREKDEATLYIAKHLMGEQRLQPERESRYYVAKEIDDFSLGVYYKGSQEEHLRHTTMTKGFPVNYREGFSRQLAEAIVAEFGGTIEEIK
ncbi:hypothetical protein ACRHK7_00415 [Weissella tructae]|uniref:hypothetical protein n=1 Tax=Weissella tructae TaxID=887702 RepID=UPI003D935C44